MTAVDFDLTASFLPEGGEASVQGAGLCAWMMDIRQLLHFRFCILHFAFLQSVNSVIKKQAQVICLNRSMVFIRMFTGQFLAGCPAKQELKSSFKTINKKYKFQWRRVFA